MTLKDITHNLNNLGGFLNETYILLRHHVKILKYPSNSKDASLDAPHAT